MCHWTVVEWFCSPSGQLGVAVMALFFTVTLGGPMNRARAVFLGVLLSLGLLISGTGSGQDPIRGICLVILTLSVPVLLTLRVVKWRTGFPGLPWSMPQQAGKFGPAVDLAPVTEQLAKVGEATTRVAELVAASEDGRRKTADEAARIEAQANARVAEAEARAKDAIAAADKAQMDLAEATKQPPLRLPLYGINENAWIVRQDGKLSIKVRVWLVSTVGAVALRHIKFKLGFTSKSLIGPDGEHSRYFPDGTGTQHVEVEDFGPPGDLEVTDRPREINLLLSGGSTERDFEALEADANQNLRIDVGVRLACRVVRGSEELPCDDSQYHWIRGMGPTDWSVRPTRGR